LGGQGTAGELTDTAVSQTRRASVVSAALYVAWLLAAWVIAWIAFDESRDQVAWLTTDAGAFAYWSVLKLVVWAIPALWLIKASGRTIAEMLGAGRLAATLAWGLGAGLIFSAINIALKGGPTAPDFSWALINAVLVAPAVEETAFRGAVLGALTTRLSFPVANTVTAALFVLSHMPGWWFQGRLMDMLTRPIGGALSIFILGWLFGWIAYKARSTGAAMIAHALNNFSNIG
jgi:membrane protease YdiL (CAAX protease family)